MRLVCALLALAQLTRAQHEAEKDEGLDDMLTPMHGETCGYESCLPVQPGWLNVHIVPQTHSELGHVFTFDQHFTGEDKEHTQTVMNMKRILDAVLTQLWDDNRRKFTLSDTAYLFHWWNHRHPTVHRMMYELVRQGRLTVVGGGLSISDEASTSYHAIIDQYTYSLRKLNQTFRACVRPLVAWAVDVYGHSREFTSLMAQMGFDALFINPISYDEEIARMRRRALEFVWRGSDDLGSATDLFTHNLFDGYWAPPGFCFSKLCSDPLLVTSNDLFTNIRDRVDKFIEGVLYRQSPHYETRNIMVIMGHRKAYFDADIWFANIEKLIAFTNWRAQQRGFNITLFYSNPACYLTAVHDENPELETKQDDFFPYVHDKDSYTVGMYTSRPTFKYLIREGHIYLQIAKQMEVSANLDEDAAMFEDFNWVMGVVQDHSVATGVLRQPVKDYYVSRIDAAITESTRLMSRGFTKLRESPAHVLYRRCLFNISSCEATRYIKYTIQVYNPLGWRVTMPVRLPVLLVNSKFRVYDNNGKEVKSEIIKLPDEILDIKERVKADHEVVFIANNLPPVGFRSYYVEAQFNRSKRTLIKRVKMAKTKKYLINMPVDEQESDQAEEIDKNTETVDIEVKNVKDTNIQNGRTKITEMKVLGSEPNEDVKKTLASEVPFALHSRNPKSISNAPRRLATVVLKDKHVNERNVIEIESNGDKEDVDRTEKMETVTEAELVMLPMLRDYLNKENILRKLDFSDIESDFMPSGEFSKDELSSTTEMELETVNSATPETEFRRAEYSTRYLPTIVPDLMSPSTTDIESDIMVPRRKTQEPDIRVIVRTRAKSTTESDIRVPFRADRKDIRVPFRVGSGIRMPMKENTKEPNIREANRELDKKGTVEESTEESDIRVSFSRKSDIRTPSSVKSDVAPTRVAIGESDIRGAFKTKLKTPVMRARSKTISPKTVQNENLPINITTTASKQSIISYTEPVSTTDNTETIPTNTENAESLAIVPVRTTTIEPTVTLSEYWYLPASTESVLVVPVSKAFVTSPPSNTTMQSFLTSLKRTTSRTLLSFPNITSPKRTTTQKLLLSPKRTTTESLKSPTVTKTPFLTSPKITTTQTILTSSDTIEVDASTTTEKDEEDEEEDTTTTKPVSQLETISIKANLNPGLKTISVRPEDYKPRAGLDSDSFIDTDHIVDPEDFGDADAFDAQNTENLKGTVQKVTVSKKLGTLSEVEMVPQTVTDQSFTNYVVSTDFSDVYGSTGLNNNPVEGVTKPTKTEKYFKSDGGRDFIGNKYVRVNLNRKRRVASVVLSNGVRMSLAIKMFHYVSDDPDKDDIRTVPRRTVKPPGAYIFRPIDPHIINMDQDYDVKIVKTDLVEEIRMPINDWGFIMIRLYVDSPVIEVHWLVGPIPTQNGLGKDVFIRYTTDLEHDNAFYTDSNGRQTIKRIRGTRATYEPLNLDPIAGNLYPVTSKIYIEDLKRNVRFSVFNDRCQAGGSVVDGAVDLMLHRRILTDDIGFGAYLNETDKDGEGIRAAGVHYLYLTKADKNRIFEKKFAKEIAMAPRVLSSDPFWYSDNIKNQFDKSKNEFSALNGRLPIGVHLLSFERLSPDELLVRLENYLEKSDVRNDGVKYVALRKMFNDIRVIWLKETTLAANLFKDQWAPTQWKMRTKFYRSFNDYYGRGNETYEETADVVTDELGGRGVRLAPQQIRTFIIKYEYTRVFKIDQNA